MPAGRNNKHLVDQGEAPPVEGAVVKTFIAAPDDNADLPNPGQWLHVSQDATLRVELWYDDAPRDLFFKAGVFHPVALKKVHDTGTDAGVVITIGE